MITILIPTTSERKERLAKCVEAINRSVCSVPIIIVSFENNIGWVAAVHEMIKGLDDSDLVFVLGDDAIVAPDCLQILWNSYHSSSVGNTELFQPDDGFHNAELATFPFCTVHILRKYLYKGYHHLWADNELTMIMKSMRVYIAVKDAKVDHQHFLKDRKLIDKTYADSQSWNEKDRSLFMQRQKDGFKSLNI